MSENVELVFDGESRFYLIDEDSLVHYDEADLSAVTETWNICPRENGGVECCWKIHCEKHMIHQILRPWELLARSDVEIIKTIFLLEETCLVDHMLSAKFCEFLEGRGINLSASEIASIFSTQTDRIKQIETKALRKLRHSVSSHKLRTFL